MPRKRDATPRLPRSHRTPHVALAAAVGLDQLATFEEHAGRVLHSARERASGHQRPMSRVKYSNAASGAQGTKVSISMGGTANVAVSLGFACTLGLLDVVRERQEHVLPHGLEVPTQQIHPGRFSEK